VTSGRTPVRLVAVGASLGGFDALKTLLADLPADLPAPVVVVQHQGGNGGGLGELLQRYARLPVCEAEDKEGIGPGRAYLAPAGYHLLVEQGSIALSTDAPVLYARPSIDVTFESAADAYGAGVVGVVLTGAGRDGAAGLRRIAAGGGRAIVEDPATARRRDMPAAALAAVPGAEVLPLSEIGPRIVALCRARRAGPPVRTPSHAEVLTCSRTYAPTSDRRRRSRSPARTP
jgi:two-component system, chemotaxis family, protein-glutamate methylesterase/glutaminase